MNHFFLYLFRLLKSLLKMTCLLDDTLRTQTKLSRVFHHLSSRMSKSSFIHLNIIFQHAKVRSKLGVFARAHIKEFRVIKYYFCSWSKGKARYLEWKLEEGGTLSYMVNAMNITTLRPVPDYYFLVFGSISIFM